MQTVDWIAILLKNKLVGLEHSHLFKILDLQNILQHEKKHS